MRISKTIENVKINTHQIKTVQDIISLLDEKNIDLFIKDFKEYLIEIISAKKIVKQIAKRHGISPPSISEDSFNWTEQSKQYS